MRIFFLDVREMCVRFDVNSIKQPQFENPYQEEEEEEKEEFCWLGTLEMTAVWASFGFPENPH